MQGETALHWAASEEHTQIVELLLSKGADVNAQAKNVSQNADFCALSSDCAAPTMVFLQLVETA